MSSESQREPLPFEPKNKKKKTPKKAPPSPAKVAEKSSAKTEASLAAIPDAVSQRMVRRMALFSGIPTSLGILSFFISYWIVSHDLFKLPTSAVLLVSIGFFGLGVLGLSYGLFSSSWDENRLGSWLGLEEVGPNFRQTRSAWREGRKEAKQRKEFDQN